MRILIACDSFKDALSAQDVCRAIHAGLAQSHPDAEIIDMPLSDGGEGLLDILRAPLSLEIIEAKVSDPLGRPVMGRYGLAGDFALVEMAEASGLQRLELQERDPLRASSFGTGQLLADAKARGARRILLGIGGSATNDAGTGMAAALGWRFLDGAGSPVTPAGGNLCEIAKIIAPRALIFEQVEVLCDVTNPLFGANGAAWIYGRQKGARENDLAALDEGLRHVASLAERQLGLGDLAQMPGAGAAGGLGFGALAFLGARLVRGIDTVLDLIGFAREAMRADLIITGEGRIDGQSLKGKTVQGVCAKAGKTPVIALCGILSASENEIAAMGLKSAFCINDSAASLVDMLAATGENLKRSAARLIL